MKEQIETLKDEFGNCEEEGVELGLKIEKLLSGTPFNVAVYALGLCIGRQLLLLKLNNHTQLISKYANLLRKMIDGAVAMSEEYSENQH